jgi:hypothetical protein
MCGIDDGDDGLLDSNNECILVVMIPSS